MHRKTLDRAVQTAKWRYCKQMQDLVMTLHTENAKEYWRYTGKIGIGKERSSHILWDVTAENGSVLTDINKVLDHLKTELLNPASDTQVPHPDPWPPLPPVMPLMDTGLDDEIFILAIRKALAKAKNGQAVGYDTKPVEAIRNDAAIHFLHKLVNVCFYSGCIPEVWYNGIINPIPKGSALDPKDPLSAFIY